MAFPLPGIMLHSPGKKKEQQAQGATATLGTFQKCVWEVSAQAVSIFLIACQMAILDQSSMVNKEKGVWMLAGARTLDTILF